MYLAEVRDSLNSKVEVISQHSSTARHTAILIFSSLKRSSGNEASSPLVK